MTNLEDFEQEDVRGAALELDEAKVTIRNVPDKPGAAAAIFGEIARNHVNVDMIVQNVSDHGATDLTFTVLKSDLPTARRVSEKFAKSIGAGSVEVDENIGKVSLVGVGMRSHSGVAEKMFGALAENKINIKMISTSEIKISVLVDGSRGEDALRAVHDAFQLGNR